MTQGSRKGKEKQKEVGWRTENNHSKRENRVENRGRMEAKNRKEEKEAQASRDVFFFLLWAMWAPAQGAIYLGAHEHPQKKKKRKKEAVF